MLEIGDDRGVALIQIAGGRIVAIALLRYRQADDANRLIRHRVENRPRRLLVHQYLADASDDPCPRAGAGALHDRVEVVLWRQGITHRRAAQADTGDAPIKRRARQSKHVVGELGLVCPMEIANAEMHNTRCQAGMVIGRTAHPVGQVAKSAVA